MTDGRNSGKVLPFRQSADFYISRGDEKRDGNDLPGAIRHYRQAFEMDPSDSNACFALCEALNRVRRFEESNRILMVFMAMCEPVTEFYYGISCNYFGMGEFTLAAEAAEAYLSIDPDGMFADSAEEMLSVLEDEEELAEAAGMYPGEKPLTMMVCNRARQTLNAGNAEAAEEMLSQYLLQQPDAWRARLALAELRMEKGEFHRASELIRDVMKKEPDNETARMVYIHCLLREKRTEEAETELDRLETRKIMSPDLLAAAARMLAETGRLEQAKQAAFSALADLPCDEALTHLYAVLCHMTGDDESAKKCYLDLSSTDPDDTVAAYYLSELGSGDSGKKVWPFEYRVSLPETAKRLAEVDLLLGKERIEALEQWTGGPDARRLLNWALGIADPEMRGRILMFLGTMGDSRAEEMLRDFLLRTDQPDSLKQAVFAVLGRMNAPQPYMAYLGGQWVEGHVSEAELPPDTPRAYRSVLERTIQSLEEDPVSEPARKYASVILREYLASCRGDYPRITAKQEIAMSGALELYARGLAEHPVSDEEICDRYGISRIRLDNAMTKLFSAFHMEEED